MVQFLRDWLLYTIGLCFMAAQGCLGGSEAVKTGIGIFDTLYIAGSGTLGVHGDIHLVKAHVLGEGSLAMKAEGEATITSEQSEVNNLEISTKSTVTLAGQLTVKQSITLTSGIFDIALGTLTLDDSAALELQKGTQLLQHYKVTSLPARGTHPHQVEISGKAILTSLPKGDRRFFTNSFQQYNEAASHPLLVYKDVASVPPEYSMMIDTVLDIHHS